MNLVKSKEPSRSTYQVEWKLKSTDEWDWAVGKTCDTFEEAEAFIEKRSRTLTDPRRYRIVHCSCKPLLETR